MSQPEWIDLPDGTRLHRTTVDYREKAGWSKEDAEGKPVRPRLMDGEESIASRARADKVTPGEVQRLMREFSATYEQARDYVVAQKGN